MSNLIMRRKSREVKDRYVVYTDGSANSKNPGASGWVCLVYKNDDLLFVGRGGLPEEYQLTNNQAELKAILMALQGIAGIDRYIPGSTIQFVSDSEYALGVCFGGYKAKANRLLIQQVKGYIDVLSKRYRITHLHQPREEKHIQLCDQYANKCRKENNYQFKYTSA